MCSARTAQSDWEMVECAEELLQMLSMLISHCDCLLHVHTYVNPTHTHTHQRMTSINKRAQAHIHKATLLHRNTLLHRLTNSGSWWGRTENRTEIGPAEESQKLKQWELTMIGIFVVNNSVIIHNQHYTQWKPIRQQNIWDNLLLLETSMTFNYNRQIIKTTLPTPLFL